jgi:hypothetical protein
VPGSSSSMTSAGIALGGSVGLKHFRVYDQSIAILHQQVSAVAQLRLLAFDLLSQQRLGIGFRLMRLIRPLLPAKVHRGIAGIIGRWLLLVLRLETLCSRPGFQQRAVDCEMLVRNQALGSRFLYYARQKLLGYVGLQQAVPILREHGRVPHFVVQV